MGLTVSEVWERDPDALRAEVYRSTTIRSNMSPHLRLDVVALDTDAGDIVHIITAVAHGQQGNGRAWVSPVQHLRRVRTGEAGIDAL